MKLHYTIIASAIIMIACNSTVSTSNNKSEFNADKEQQNILAVIEKETASFFARDYEGWKAQERSRLMISRDGIMQMERLK